MPALLTGIWNLLIIIPVVIHFENYQDSMAHFFYKHSFLKMGDCKGTVLSFFTKVTLNLRFDIVFNWVTGTY